MKIVIFAFMLEITALNMLQKLTPFMGVPQYLLILRTGQDEFHFNIPDHTGNRRANYEQKGCH